MNKLKMESKDMTQYNVERIAEMFPQVVTEVKVPSNLRGGGKILNNQSVIKKAIDFDKLKLILSAGSEDYEIIDDERERYEFTWVGKRQAMIDAATPIRKTLRPCPEESVNFDTTENMYIEGDNLEVLKLLQESYLGKIKMIYIDPPYNTGKDFVYRDNFKQSADEYNEEAGMYDEDDNKLFQNTETNGRFHSDWCSMIYPRLQLARNLLTDDGVIFISIDDNEVENLKKICVEVFGAQSYLTSIIWHKKTGASDAKGIATITEYILVYCKDKSNYEYTFSKNTDSYDLTRYKYKDEHYDKRGQYYIDNLDRGGLQYSDSLNYGIICPDGTITYPNGRLKFYNDGWIWKWSKQKIKWAIKNDFLEFRESKTKESGWSVCYKNYLNVDNEDKSIERAAPHKNVINDVMNANAALGMKKLFDTNNYFNYSKPYELIYRLLNYVRSNNSIVLDFFSGSATTAHAVMQLNAEDGGNRKFIMVQLPEETDEKSEARKAGYKNICEIGKERIRRAGVKIVEENKGKDLFAEKKNKLDIGFRVFKTDTTNMNDVYYSADAIDQDDIFAMVSNIKEDRTDIDLLYGALLDWGVELTYPHTAEQIDGYTVHMVDTPLTDEIDIIACFDENISEKAIREIASRKPLRALFRDHSFANSANKINVYEIFKAVAPDTSVRVI
ncbi:MAG: site-specific DNA-methyltransferase [bacterium]